MSEMGVSSSVLDAYEKISDSFYPIWFGVSCAFAALRALSEPGTDGERWSELCSQMLQGSAKLLGLLVWRIQKNYVEDGKSELLRKLESAEKEINSLKEMRLEDAKANEKAVGKFAVKEQRLLFEQKKLQQHIAVLGKELKNLVKKKEESILELNRKLKEMVLLIQCKDVAITEEEGKRTELEEKLMKAEKTVEEFRETAKLEAQERSTDILRHKTAFLEVVSNQRRLESDLGRALKQLEAKREELDLVLEQKKESALLAEKLSFEVVKLHKDLEQKDKLLSATLRKSKLEKTEKQMLSKEVKTSKVKKKQAELESERWRLVSGTKDLRRERRSLRDMFACNARIGNPGLLRDTQNEEKAGSHTIEYALEYESPEFHIDAEAFSPIYERYSTEENDGLEIITAVIKQLEDWFRVEAEKYATVIQKRHSLEIDAFVEQMKLKDEKLDAFCCRLLDMEVESKGVQSFAEGLNQEMSHLRSKNKKLEALLLERQEEVNALKEQLVSQAQSHVCNCLEAGSSSSIHDTVLEVKAIERNSPDITEDPNHQPTNVNAVQPSENKLVKEMIFRNEDSVEEKRASSASAESVLNLGLPIKPLTKSNSSPWKKDLHALGVSYKVKRLKQQLILLERLTGKQESSEKAENNGSELNETKTFASLMSLLNKQVSRYQSLQDRTDELCNRLQENVETKQGDSSKAKRETKTLKNFLEETLQLQRCMVASGQKSIEVQSKIESGFAELPERLDQSLNFDTKKFTDNINSLFQDVQKGFEVRIARIIGDLEGTLARDGMIHMRR